MGKVFHLRPLFCLPEAFPSTKPHFVYASCVEPHSRSLLLVPLVCLA